MRIDYEKRIFGLDLMRAIAIIMVMCSHTLWIVPEMRGITRKLFSVFGILGVDVFFVLSGFLIGRILYKMYISTDFTFKDMTYSWVRRWFRTLPNYYLALVINILVAIYIGNQLPDQLWKYGFFPRLPIIMASRLSSIICELTPSILIVQFKIGLSDCNDKYEHLTIS